MSEFTGKNKILEKEFYDILMELTDKGSALDTIKRYEEDIKKITFREVINIIHKAVEETQNLEKLKTGINKFLNVVYTALNEASLQPVPENDFLWYLSRNNEEMILHIDNMKSTVMEFTKSESKENAEKLKKEFEYLQRFSHYYLIKENILFPVLEREWDNAGCVKVMWSFHDDIRKNIKRVISVLDNYSSNNSIDKKEFHRIVGDIYFRMKAIRFRDEKILFPRILETIDSDVRDSMLLESFDFEWPYVKPDEKLKTILLSKSNNSSTVFNDIIKTETGELSVEQLELIFSNLQVDITFIDENDKVKFFSNNKNRIFPRTKAIIGRDVRNCHPPESVHIVEKILTAFKENKKDKARFWLKMKGMFVFINYIPLRDKEGNYKGVLEITQEVSEIKALQGEKRLLDWD